ncbi:MAG TPA: hypothetical protein PLA44_09820 [Propionibacteriaceae bacterium]|nr:hypothetical protein [Propionibacteriaceae bacterium]
MKSAGAFLEWLLVGGLFSLAFVGMLTIGPYVLVVSLVALLAAAKLIGTRVIMALVSGWASSPSGSRGTTDVVRVRSVGKRPQPRVAVSCTTLAPGPSGVGLVIVGLVLAVMVHRTRREPLAGGGSDKH